MGVGEEALDGERLDPLAGSPHAQDLILEWGQRDVLLRGAGLRDRALQRVDCWQVGRWLLYTSRCV